MAMAPLSKAQETTARLRAPQIQRFNADSSSRKDSGSELLAYAFNPTENDMRLASVLEPAFEMTDEGGRYPQEWTEKTHFQHIIASYPNANTVASEKSQSLSTCLRAFRVNAQQLVDNNVKGTPSIELGAGEPEQEAEPVSEAKKSSPSPSAEVAASMTVSENQRVTRSNPQPETTQKGKAVTLMHAIQPASFPAIPPSTSSQPLFSSSSSSFGSYDDSAHRLVIEEQNDKMSNIQKMLESLILKSQQDDKRMAELEMREKKRLDEEQRQRQVAADKARNDKAKAKTQEVVTNDDLPTLKNDHILTGDNMKRFWDLHRRVRDEHEARDARRRFFDSLEWRDKDLQRRFD
ncbi:hypothetical protein CEP51_014478 [Fusarium floridanum]|uniref:Uncharacterized protein n=1 Tax=Fusarium floridanum TaxID=1325733 RepID=A0A428PS75_9HYPO|nr:hypothetical protein CEP51_014478 [Fusarium floridanum]